MNGFGTATPLDSRTVQLRVPQSSSDQVRFLARVQDLNIRPPQNEAKVILNFPAPALFVINRTVTLDGCAVAHGNLAVTVERQNTGQPAGHAVCRWSDRRDPQHQCRDP